MSQYLLLKSDGEPDDPSVGLTSDSQGEGGVLGGDNYEAAATSHNGYLELSADAEYVAIDSFLESSTITGMTVMAWVRSTDSSGEDYISSHDRSEYYRFNLNDGEFDCSFDTSGGGGDHNSGVFVADGQWHHLAAVYDAGEVRMYVDGRRVYTNTGNATEIGSGGTRYGFLGAGSEAEVFDGDTNANAGVHDIAEHRLYLDAKTDAEVEAAFEGNPPTAGLHEYLPLTADDAGRLNDASGNGRHGYLRNGASVRDSGQFTSWYRFEDAEDADFSDWTVNEGTLTADSNQAIGTNSMFHDGMAGVDSGETNDPRGAVKSLGEAEQVSGFTFTYWETSSNTSAALSFYNSDGQREFSLGTDNPAWGYDDASGNNSFGNPGEYEDWMQFTITFNWSQSQYTVKGKDLQTGYTALHTGDLYHGTDIAEVASGQVGLVGYTGGGQWHLDQMFVETTNDQTTPLYQSSSFDTANTTSSSPIGNTQAASMADQLGGGTTSSSPAANVAIASSSVLVGGGTSTTLSNALRDAFTASTFGNSSSDTTAGGLTELFTHADQPADLDTSSVTDAFTESFDAIDRTGIGDALSTVTGDTTVATTQTIQSLEDAIAEPLVAAETAALTSQSADGSFGETFADVLRASGSSLPTSAVGDAAVTSLGTTQVSTATPQFDVAEVEIFAFVSPESATVTPRVSGGETTTNAVALTEDAVMVPITPTMDVVIQVRTGQLGVEGKFADSLAASVGASTSIKVAKTVADAEEQTGGVDTSVVPDAIAATAEVIQQSGDGFADSTAEALAVAAALQSFASSSSATDVVGSEGVASATDVGADGFSSATPDAAVRDVVASELDASADTSATSEALAEAAQTLTAEGLADTQAEAAALVAQVAARLQQGGVDTFAGVEGLTEEFESIERVGRPSSFTLSEAAREVFSPEEIDTDALAEALPLISATLVSTVNVNGAASTDATSDGDVTGADMSPVDALLRILFAAIEGSNAAIPITEQNVRVENDRNYVEVVN